MHIYFIYSKVPIIGPPIVPVKSGLDSEQVSLMSPIYIDNCILVLKQVGSKDWVVLISGGLFRGGILLIISF